VSNAGDRNTFRRIATLERTHNPTATPRVRPLDEKASELLHMLILECERPKRITLE
jgi:hypothetical protein